MADLINNIKWLLVGIVVKKSIHNKKTARFTPDRFSYIFSAD